MLDILARVEKDLPRLLMQEGWKSLYIDYHPPVVERMYRTWDQDQSVRICLHWIHACDRYTSLYHKHPWPSACKLLTGAYWMRIGSSEGEDSPGSAAGEILLRAPSAYEMLDREGWHSVSPLVENVDDLPEMSIYRQSSGGSLSLMVNGTPWSTESTKPTKKLHPLSDSQQQNLLDRFRYWYPYRFIDFVRRGTTFPSAIDNFVGFWHAGDTGVETLHEYLGLTWEEYSSWVENASCLSKLLLKKRQEFEDRLGTLEGFPWE